MSIDWGIRTSGVVVSSLFLRYFSEQNNVYCAVKTKVYGETMCVVVFCWLRPFRHRLSGLNLAYLDG